MKTPCSKGNLRSRTSKAINLLFNKISKTASIVSLEVESQDVLDSNDIAQSVNKFFCSVVEKFSDNIPYLLR